MSEIRMNSEELGKNAEDFKNYAEEYTTNLNKIKDAVESLKPYWTDAAGTEFFSRFEQKYDVVKEMGPAIEALGNAVAKTRSQFDQAIDDSISTFK